MKDTIGRENRKLEDKICPVCGKTFRPLSKKSKYCSRKCAWSQNGKSLRSKKGSRRINQNGYAELTIWTSDNKWVQVKEHRYIVEQSIGRKLLPDEDVHHKDGNKLNNNLDNLEIISHAEHTRLSNKNRTYKTGYSMNLTPEARKARSERAKNMKLDELGRKALLDKSIETGMKE